MSARIVVTLTCLSPAAPRVKSVMSYLCCRFNLDGWWRNIKYIKSFFTVLEEEKRRWSSHPTKWYVTGCVCCLWHMLGIIIFCHSLRISESSEIEKWYFFQNFLSIFFSNFAFSGSIGCGICGTEDLNTTHLTYFLCIILYFTMCKT